MSRKFKLIRQNDFGGISGTGHVLDGIEFDNGKVAVTWYTKNVSATSVAVYDSYKDFDSLHVSAHPDNNTKVIWEDDPGFNEN